ncbi:MAG: 2-dehydropantoate 2-reductase, partial [Verrucomicrobiota bacterium]|nr:2-dehydropantoate 2-reductase [Verrucomicrobiota bacterium]
METTKPLRVVVVGAGGVGGCFGARLAQGGCEVSFVARGAQLAALCAEGLRIESELGDIHFAKVRVSEDASALGPADVVLLCVKLWDTEVAARAIEPIVGAETAVISLQNGVSNEAVLRRILGERAVLGGVSYVVAKILRPGVIRQTGTMQRIVFGEMDERVSARAQRFLAACERSGIEAELSRDIRRAIWEKFVFETGTSATTTSMRATIGPVRAHAQTRAFL